MIKVVNYTDKAKIYIYGVVIEDTDAHWLFNEDGEIIGYVWPDKVKKDLEAMRGKPVDVHIASDGGDVAAGIALFNMLKEHDAPVVVYVDSWAASIASVIAFSGTKIVMPENTFLMIHNPSGGGFGDSEYLRSIADWLDKIKDIIANVYVSNMKGDMTTEEKLAKCRELMDKETWFTAKEAAEFFENVELTERNEVKAVANLRSSISSAPAELTEKAAKNKIIKVLMEAYGK